MSAAETPQRIHVWSRGEGIIVSTSCPPPPGKARIRIKLDSGGREFWMPLFSGKWEYR